MGKQKRRREYKTGTIYRRGSRYYYEHKAAGIRKRSLGTDDYETAKSRAKQRFGWVELQSDKEQQEELLRKYQNTAAELEKAKASRLPLERMADEYEKVLKIKSKNGNAHSEAGSDSPLAPNTLYTTKKIIHRFVDHVRKQYPDVKTMDDVTPQLAEEYFLSLREEGYTAASYNNHLANLRVVFKRLSIQAGLSSNPFEKVEVLKQNRVDAEASPKDVFTRDQLRTMQDRASGWIRPAMFIGYYTGLRLSDVVTLRWSWIDLEGGFFQIPQTRKSSKAHLIYAPEVIPYLKEWVHSQSTLKQPSSNEVSRVLGIAKSSAYKVLNLGNAPCAEDFSDLNEFYRALCQAGIDAGMETKGINEFRGLKQSGEPPLQADERVRDFVFPRLAAAVLGIGRKRDDARPSKEFQRFLMKTCGFNTKNEKGKTVLGFHSLRVSHATYSKANGVNEETIQDLLGHSSLQTTEGYIRRSIEEKKQEIRSRHTSLPMPGGSSEWPQIQEETTRMKAQRLVENASDEKLQEVVKMLEGSPTV